MRAYSLHGVGDLRWEEVPEPALEPGWCLVRVAYAGICSSDVPRVFTKGTYRFPTIPGHEFSGTVVAAASPADAGWVGRRAGVFPLVPCRDCPQCAKGLWEMCEYYDYVGSRRDGGFAELVAVPAWNFVELPDTVPLEAAAMLEPLSVALHAVRRAGDLSGRSVAVSGSGMIGFAAALWAKALGASEVAVLGRSPSKASVAEAVGVGYLVPSGDGWGISPDVAVEAVGSNASVLACVEGVAPGGAVVCMGNPEGDVSLPQDVYWRVLRKQLTLTGTWNSSFKSPAGDDWAEAVRLLASGSLDASALVTHLFPREDLPRGLELMRTHAEPYCKVMTAW